MDDALRRALSIDRTSTAQERTVDITTIGARSGKSIRIETWFYRHEGTVYLSGLPGKRDWYANVIANPRLTFHLKHGVRADLPATATPITDAAERRRIFTAFVDDLNQPHNPGRISQPTHVEDWMAGSPLVALTFDE